MKKNILFLAFVGVLLASPLTTMTAGGIEEPDVRDCARELCFQLRNCEGGEDVDGVEKPDASDKVSNVKTAKSSEASQSEIGSCREWAYFEYVNCAGGQGFTTDKDTGVDKTNKTVIPLRNQN